MCVCEYGETPQMDTFPCISIKADVSVVVVLAELLSFLWFLIPSPFLFCKLCSFVFEENHNYSSFVLVIFFLNLCHKE